jgi:ankyrin repeat protein
MTSNAQPHRAHLYLIEVIIIVALLGGAAFLLVRNLKQAKHRAQLQRITEVLNNWDNPFWRAEERESVAPTIFALAKLDTKLLHARGNNGSTPLHVAAYLGDRDIVQWLLDHNADIRARTNQGWTPLHCAALTNAKNVAELLIAKGTDVNAKTYGGMTPLHCAVRGNAKDMVEFLIAKGADLNMKDNDDETPLEAAVSERRPAIADLLRAHGAKE